MCNIAHSLNEEWIGAVWVCFTAPVLRAGAEHGESSLQMGGSFRICNWNNYLGYETVEEELMLCVHLALVGVWEIWVSHGSCACMQLPSMVWGPELVALYLRSTKHCKQEGFRSALCHCTQTEILASTVQGRRAGAGQVGQALTSPCLHLVQTKVLLSPLHPRGTCRSPSLGLGWLSARATSSSPAVCWEQFTSPLCPLGANEQKRHLDRAVRCFSSVGIKENDQTEK